MDERIQKLRERLREDYCTAIDAEGTAGTNQVVSRVMERLERNRETMALKLLGFETSYGDYRISTDKNAPSLLRDEFEAQLNAKAAEWIRENIVPLFEKGHTALMNNQKLKARMVSEFKSYYEHHLLTRMRELARVRGQEDAEKLQAEFIKELTGA